MLDSHQQIIYDIAQVVETSSARDTNDYLKKGWILLAINQKAEFYEGGYGHSRTNYILGRPKSITEELED